MHSSNTASRAESKAALASTVSLPVCNNRSGPRPSIYDSTEHAENARPALDNATTDHPSENHAAELPRHRLRH
eukprot:5607180-Pyramimonas_sp.AAC.1